MRSIGQTASLHRFIADCLWDYHADTRITRSVFVGRYCVRVADNEEVASQIFDALSETVYEDVKEVIEIEKLIQALNKPAAKLPAVLLNEDNALLIVSTIHKAKGREFDTVFLLDSGFMPTTDDTEESRTWYVGCTRAKTNLYKLAKTSLYLRRSSTYSSRWMQLNNHRVRWTQRLLSHCRNIVLGLPMDFLETGFVRGDFYDALKTQEYIAEKVKVGDTVDVKLVNEKYQVRHAGNIVGYLSENMFIQLLSVARESNPASSPPPYLFPIYVSNIITITPPRFPDGVVPYFRESRFWLGLELTGFPKIDWHYTQSEEISTND